MEAQNEPTIVKDSKIWLDDGNLVIRTRLEGAWHYLFKCHKSVLAAYSPVFADMFSVPQTDQSNEKFEGIDLVDFPDHHEDVRHLLYAVYDSGWLTSYETQPGNDEYFSIISGILRLATKYEINNVRLPMIKLPKNAWPANLAEWTCREAIACRTLENKPRSVVYDGSWVEHFYPEPALIISIAEEFGIKDVLPVAYYHLSRVHPGSTTTELYVEHSLSRRGDRLTTAQLTRVLAGQLKMRTDVMGFFQRMVLSPAPLWKSDACLLADGRCEERSREWWKTAATTSDLVTNDPLALLRELEDEIRGPSDETDLCADCRSWTGSQIQKESEEFWEHLGHYFHLQD